MALGRDKSIFIDEALRFLDYYVKGDTSVPIQNDPTIEVQDGSGSFRAESQYPPADTSTYTSSLNLGTYTDDGNNQGTGGCSIDVSGVPGCDRGFWSFSQPLPHDVWMSGEPVLQVRVNTLVPRANLVADVYDVAPGGQATLVSRGAELVRGAGTQNLWLKMYPEDWRLVAGHRLGVLISGSNAEWWINVPTGTGVTVDSASIALPFLTYDRTHFLPGTTTPRLDDWLANGNVEVSDATITAGQREFNLPPKLIEPAQQQR
jgi:predicted acyl esterase